MTITIGIRNFRSYLTNDDQNETENGFFQFRFERGVNLLKGGSGTGKSTVFMAISWCLYKKPALGNTPLYRGSAKGETAVVLHVEDEIRIVRRSPGSLLSVHILDDPSEPTLENEEAQNYIYRRFGRETVWRSCNYVQQGSLNPMISGELSEGQRWDVLYGITLDTDPQNRITIDRLKNALKIQLESCSKIRAQREIELDIYSRDLERKREETRTQTLTLETLLNEYPEIRPPFSRGNTRWKTVRELFERAALKPYVGAEELESHRSAVQGLTVEIEKIHRDLLIWEGELETLRKEETRQVRKLESRGETILAELRPVRAKLDVFRESLRLCRDVRETVQKMCGGDEELLGYVDRIKVPTFSEYHRRVSRLLGTLIWLRGFLKTYSMEELQTPVEEIERRISQHGFVERTTELKSKIEALEIMILAERDIGGGLKKVLAERGFQEWGSYLPTNTISTPQPNQLVYTVTCPCCEKRIRTVIDKSGQHPPAVEVWSDSPSIPEGVIEKVRRHDILVRNLRDVPLVDKPEDIGSKDRWMKLLPRAEAWGREPATFQQIVMDLLPLAEKIDEFEFRKFEGTPHSRIDPGIYQNPNDETGSLLEREIAQMEEGLANVEAEIRAVRREHGERISRLKIDRVSRLTIQKVEREAEIRERRRLLGDAELVRRLWEEIATYGFPDGPAPKEGFIVALKTVEETLAGGERLRTELAAVEEKTRMLKDELINLTGKQDTINRLQICLEKVETDVLAESVRTISGSANEFLENCFDNPMLVQLTTEKESKGGKTKKHSVNLSIKSGRNHGGLLERGLDGFSGGEMDRISLGFSSAVTGFSPFPMLLLDECISSLDSDMKDKTIRALRQQAKRLNKTIVLVCHDAVEGLFDHVCQLE